MQQEVNELIRHEGTIYGLAFLVCTNKETTRDAMGLGLDDDLATGKAVDLAENAAIESIQAAGFDCGTESNFHKWHGGPLRNAPVHMNWFVAVEELADEDDADSWEIVGWEPIWLAGAGKTDVPAEVIAKATATQDAAIEAAQQAASKAIA